MMQCPYLPRVSPSRPIRATRIRALGFGGDDLYLLRLKYAQSLLLEQKPAQALLQLNKAFSMTGLSEAVITDYPWPYGALSWILKNHTAQGFLGNPVRHFQHYATRMSGENFEVRVWRAWACFALSEKILGDGQRDEEQIEKEGIKIPFFEEIEERLSDLVSSEEKLKFLYHFNFAPKKAPKPAPGWTDPKRLDNS